MKRILIIIIATLIMCSCGNDIDNEIRTTEDTSTLNVPVWDVDPIFEFDDIEILVDNLRIRKGPGTDCELVSTTNVRDLFYVYSKEENEGYTWYQIYDSNDTDLWIADKDGEWVKELN